MSYLAALLDLVLPHSCGGCGGPLGPLCATCRPTAAARLVEGQFRTYAVGDYDGRLRAALLAYKERGRRDLAGPLGELLARAVAAAIDARRGPPAVLVPVPSARSAAAARGGDHLLRLARRAARSSGLRVAPRTLVLARRVRDSAGLGVAERAHNLAGAMRATAPASVATALLVDDIVTTGATLREARRALEVAGWTVAGSAVVAATPRRIAASASHWQPSGEALA